MAMVPRLFVIKGKRKIGSRGGVGEDYKELTGQREKTNEDVI